MRTKTIFISDVHLRGLNDECQKKFLEFLEEKRPHLARLFIVGDLFDFWVGYPATVYSAYFPILETLAGLRRDGVEIHYIEGNHDFHLGPFFKDFLGCKIYPDEANVELDGLKIVLLHGDLVNQRDYGGRMLRAFLRSRLVRYLIHMLPADLVWKIGHGASQVSHYFNHRHLDVRHEEKTKTLYRQFAEQKLKNSNAHILIMGHNHYPDEGGVNVGGIEKYYYNTGDWVKNFSYVEYEPSIRFQLKNFVFTPVVRN